MFDATRVELVRALELRQGSAWFRVKHSAPIAGYRNEDALNRHRAFRKDGAESLLAMVVALLYSSDVRTGFIGRPRPEGGPWQRFTLQDLAQLAFGSQDESDIRRARRAIDVMIGLGWAFPTKQVRRHSEVIDQDGVRDEWRSEPGVRRLNLARLCQMLGTSWLLKRDRIHADRVKGDGLVSIEGARRSRQKARSGPHAARGQDARRDPPRATGDPPRPPTSTGTAAQAISEILDLFKR